MKTGRTLVTLVFLLCLAVSSQADTVGPYELKYRQKVLANMYKEYNVDIILKADSLLDSDTLDISRVNCPGNERSMRYTVLFLDYSRSFKYGEHYGHHTEFVPYKIPLTSIISQYKLTGTRDYFIEIYSDGLESDKIFGTIHLHLE